MFIELYKCSQRYLGKSAIFKRMAKYSKKAQDEVKKTMHEMQKGELHVGKSDKEVTDPRQAVAIGLDKARRKGAKVPKKR